MCLLFFTSNDVVTCVSSWMFTDMSPQAHSTHDCLPTSPWFPPQGQGKMTKHDCEGPLWKATKPQVSARSTQDSNKPSHSVGTPSSAPLCQNGLCSLALSRAFQWDVDTKHRSPPEMQATIWPLPTHLQVKELAVPPVDSLGGRVGPGHVDNIYLLEKKSR